MSPSKPNWEDFVSGETLFSNAIRLRNLIWTIQRYVTPGTRVLETGFGSGTTAVLLADLGFQVTAIDLSEQLVRRVGDRYSDWVRSGRLTVRRANMLALPWTTPAFELVYHQGVLEHFPDEQIVQALQQQARVARWVIFDVPNIRYGARPYGDERLLPVAHWRRLIERAGLNLANVLGRGYKGWTSVLPYGLFSRRGLEWFPAGVRALAQVSIFVCRPKRSMPTPDERQLHDTQTNRPGEGR